MIPPRRRSTRWRVDSCQIVSATYSLLLNLLFWWRFVPYLLNIVVTERTPILQLLAREDQPLLVRWDALLILNLALHIVDCIARLDLEGDCLAREGFYEAEDLLVRFCEKIWIFVDVHLHCEKESVFSCDLSIVIRMAYWLRSSICWMCLSLSMVFGDSCYPQFGYWCAKTLASGSNAAI